MWFLFFSRACIIASISLWSQAPQLFSKYSSLSFLFLLSAVFSWILKDHQNSKNPSSLISASISSLILSLLRKFRLFIVIYSLPIIRLKELKGFWISYRIPVLQNLPFSLSPTVSSSDWFYQNHDSNYHSCQWCQPSLLITSFLVQPPSCFVQAAH